MRPFSDEMDHSGDARRGRGWRWPLPEILLAVASALLVLALGEIAVRWLDLGPSFHVVYRNVYRLSENAVLRYDLKPNSRDGDIRINSGGFRDQREPAVAKPRDTFRIVAVGDSVTFGYGCDEDATYSRALERMLNATTPRGVTRYEVLNLGVIGYNIREIGERLRSIGMRYDPDLILYGYVLNDPQSFSHQAHILESLREVEERRFGAGFGALRWLSHSRLFLLAWYAGPGPTGTYHRGGDWELRDIERGENVSIPDEGDPGFEAAPGSMRIRYFLGLHGSGASRHRLLTGLADLSRLAGDAGVPVLVAVFPLFVSDDQGRYPLARVHRLVIQASRQRGLYAVDLQPAFRAAMTIPGSEAVAIDFMHPNALGHRIAAMELSRWLRGSGLLPATPAD